MRDVFCSDTGNLFFGKLRHAVIFPLCGIIRSLVVAALFHHIGSVLCGSAKEKMCRIDTGWVIAMVAYVQAIRDRRIVHFVRKSMGANDSPSSPGALQYTISTMRFCASPKPTGICFVDISPESLFRCSVLILAAFLRGDFCGMITHVIRSFQRLTRPGIAYDNRPVFSFHSCIIPQVYGDVNLWH